MTKIKTQNSSKKSKMRRNHHKETQSKMQSDYKEVQIENVPCSIDEAGTYSVTLTFNLWPTKSNQSQHGGMM